MRDILGQKTGVKTWAIVILLHHMCQTQGQWAKSGPQVSYLWPTWYLISTTVGPPVLRTPPWYYKYHKALQVWERNEKTNKPQGCVKTLKYWVGSILRLHEAGVLTETAQKHGGHSSKPLPRLATWANLRCTQPITTTTASDNELATATNDQPAVFPLTSTTTNCKQ